MGSCEPVCERNGFLLADTPRAEPGGVGNTHMIGRETNAHRLRLWGICEDNSLYLDREAGDDTGSLQNVSAAIVFVPVSSLSWLQLRLSR